MGKSTNILQNRPRSVRIIFFLSYVLFVYLLILYVIQDDLIFYPETHYISPDELGNTSFREAPLQTSDESHIMTWFSPGETDKPAILFFHGNSGQLARFAPQLIPLANQGYTIMMMEYRGFAQTPGYINEKNVFDDAVISFDFLRKRGYRNIIAMGYSFGSAPAVAVSVRRPVSGLVLLAPFASLEQVVADSWFPFARFLLKDTYHSDQEIGQLRIPLLILHGKKDTLIPSKHSQALFQLATSPNKRLALLPESTHASLFFSGQFIPEVLGWLGQ